MSGYSTGYVWDQRLSRWIKLGGVAGGEGDVKMYYDTTDNWNLQPGLLSEDKAIYVYTDYQVLTDNVGNPTYVPGIKIGDGSANVIDLPFVGSRDALLYESFEDHINNLTIHITQAERNFWNQKCRVYKSDVEGDTIVFTTM